MGNQSINILFLLFTSVVIFSCGPKDYHENLEYKKNDGDSTIHESNITNPYTATTGSFIAQVTVGIISNFNIKSMSYFGLCTGIKLNPTTILTAAHCISKMENMRIVDGKSIFTGIKNQDIYEIENIVAHPFYSHPDYQNERRLYDIALIRLKTPIQNVKEFADVIEQFSMPSTTQYGYIKISSDENLSIPFNLAPHIAGYGLAFSHTSSQNQTNKTVGILNEASVSLQMSQYAQKVITINSNQTSQACMGDSGGPLYVWRDDKYYIQGMAISVSEPDKSDPFSNSICERQSYYLNLDFFGRWIKETNEIL